jgi:hypothetical protein
MKNPFIVRPTGLKGNEKLNRMRELMGGAPLNEDVKNSVVELTKLGPDGKVYGIVREGHNYFIKVTNKTSNILSEDFNYIGGLMNKTSEAYPSYAKAIKQLNLKFMSLNEALGKSGNFNVFEDDNLLTEHHPYKSDQKLSATKGMGDASEYIVDKSGKELSYDAKEGKEKDGFGDNLATKDVEDEFEKVKLSENEMAIDEMITGDILKGRGVELDEVSDEGKYTWKDLGDFGNDMVGDFVEYNGEYYKVIGNGTIDNENGEPVYSAGLENVKDGQRIEVSIYDITKINPNDVGIEWWDDKDVDFDGEVSDIEGKYNINSKYDDYLKESIAKIGNMTKSLSEEETNANQFYKSKKGFSIATALEKMDSIIGEETTDKVTEILNSLTESEKSTLLNTLKKKV